MQQLQSLSILLLVIFLKCYQFCNSEQSSPLSSRPAFARRRFSFSSSSLANAICIRGGSSDSFSTGYGRISDEEYILTPEQIARFHEEGCITIPDVLREEEIQEIEKVFDKFVSGEIEVPRRDFCDMSKQYDVPYEQWSLVNCMLPTKYYPPLQNNIYEKLTNSIAKQLFPNSDMTKDYDQLLNKRQGKKDAVFAWHQDMGYWPTSKVLGIDCTDTCTFSLAIDDSDLENGCLRYVVGSGKAKTLRSHKPATGGDNRDETHALVIQIYDDEKIQYAPAKRGSITIHDEYVVHGSGGNNSPDRQRRTYVLAYRAAEIVKAERSIGFTHSHNDQIDWDTIHERIKSNNSTV